jgi:hypothetical protein
VGKQELLRAFDEIQFGAGRTLNLRDALPTGADARFQADNWLRQRHAESSEPVLIVTGRGKGSTGGVAVIKEQIIALLHTLRRKGVVRSWQEHSPGALVVQLATVTDLLSAPARHRDSKRGDRSSARDSEPSALAGLDPETLKLLRSLSERTIADLGIRNAEGLIESEMLHKLSVLVPSLPDSGDREAALRAVIIRAIEEMNARKHG